MRQTLWEYCISNDRPELLIQWHAGKNEGLTPRQVSYGSKKKIWWQCERGHEWQSSVHTRTSGGSGCPYCANRGTLPGMSLVAAEPELAKQWHPTKNGTLTPEQVAPGTHRAVWWRCPQGHEWRAQVKSRTGGAGCPVCANKRVIPGVNDLGTSHPELAAQWHPEKNNALIPQKVVAGTCRKVWWRCEQGHEWQASIQSRVKGRGCPVCANKVIVPGVNDLAGVYPQLARQWVQEKNGGLRPDQVSIYSNRRVWWRCELGHQWQSVIARRTANGSACPYCAGKRVLAGFNDLASRMPEIARDWHPTLNGRLMPEQVTVGSGKRVWWQCAYGHVWKAIIYSRTGKQKTGCPVCAGRVKPRPSYLDEVRPAAVNELQQRL